MGSVLAREARGPVHAHRQGRSARGGPGSALRCDPRPESGRDVLREHGARRRHALGTPGVHQTPEYPSHGVIDSSPDITGGMGFEGLANLQRFVESGGVMMTLGSAGKLAVEGGITRRVAVKSAGHPGSHLTVKAIRPEHPMSFGLVGRRSCLPGQFSHLRRVGIRSRDDRGAVRNEDLGAVREGCGRQGRHSVESDQPAETSSADPNPGTDANDAAGETDGNDRSKKRRWCSRGS